MTKRFTGRSTRAMTLGATLTGALALAPSALVAQGQDLHTMSRNQGDWVMTGRTYDLQRYSPLNQITAETDIKSQTSF